MCKLDNNIHIRDVIQHAPLASMLGSWSVPHLGATAFQTQKLPPLDTCTLPRWKITINIPTPPLGQGDLCFIQESHYGFYCQSSPKHITWL